MKRTLFTITALLLAPLAALQAADAAKAVGASGQVGCLANPKSVARLEITKPGVYENYLVDGKWAGGNLVKITANGVTVRNCEIHSGSGNGIGVFSKNVVIENCRIHHMLAGTFKEQHDAHGITGRWGNVTIRNCDISFMSGDSVQFDPDRKSQGTVTIEHCTFWTGPLPADAAGFHKGERPGENSIDTKTMPTGERCELIVRKCYFHGFNQPAQIQNAAALNLKEHIHARIEHCILADNEIALRLRGPGKRGDARIEIIDCAIYDSQVGVRIEDKIRDLKIEQLGFGKGVARKYREAGGGAGPGYINTGEHEAPALETILQKEASSRKGKRS